MFGFSNRKEKLQSLYKQLLDEAYRLAYFDRKRSDEKTAEAEQIRQQLDALEKAGRK